MASDREDAVARGRGELGRATLRWFAAERKVLVALVVVATAAWGFVELADLVTDGETRRLDQALLLGVRDAADPTDPFGPSWLEEMMRDFTALGGVGVLTLITLGVVGYALLTGRRRLAVTVTTAVLGGVLLSSLIKAGIDRPRPDLVPHGSMVSTASFPSGHSTMAATVYLTVAAILMQLTAQLRSRVYILGAALLATGLVGVSRVYLGVHWPTDVLAGWALGSAWALLVSITVSRMRREGPLPDPI